MEKEFRQTNLLEFGDLLLGVVLGATFPYMLDILRLTDAPDGGLAIAILHAALYLFLLLSTIWYWHATKVWASHLPSHYGALDHMFIALTALLFYLLAYFCTWVDLSPFYFLVVVQGFVVQAADIWLNFGIAKLARDHKDWPYVGAVHQLQSSRKYLVRTLMFNVWTILLAVSYTTLHGRVSEVLLEIITITGLCLGVYIAERTIQRWRNQTLPLHI